jgi:phosphoribosylformylglycinamidine synthase
MNMIFFFETPSAKIYVLQINRSLTPSDISKLSWLFGGAKVKSETSLSGFFVGPRAAMVTPWSTNAVEITQNMDLQGIIRIEEFEQSTADATNYDHIF